MDFEPGAVFGRYRLIRKLGEGGMGSVFEAEHVELHKRVALKWLSGSLAKNADARARFEREAKAAARLDHPHAVEVMDVGVHNDVPFFVMEYLQGEDLEAYFEREGRLSVARIVEIALPLAAALATAHAAGIVHRDIKPQNVFLARGKLGLEVTKLLDFGISKVADGTSGSLTATSSMLGTPVYMSPEQVQASKHADPRSDQYSLAVLIYQAVAGRLPFDAVELYPLLSAIAMGRKVPLSTTCPESPGDFQAVIARAMALEREERFPTISDFARALLPFAEPRVREQWEPVFGPSERLSPPPPTAPMVQPPADVAPNTIVAVAATVDSARAGVWKWLILAGALLGLGGIGFAVWGRGSAEREPPRPPLVDRAKPVAPRDLPASPSAGPARIQGSVPASAPDSSSGASAVTPTASAEPSAREVALPRAQASPPRAKRPVPPSPVRPPAPVTRKTRNNSPILE